MFHVKHWPHAPLNFMNAQENLQAHMSKNLLNPVEIEGFQAWKTLLERWNDKINLVSKSAMEDFWTRHALDSWQLWPLVPEDAETLIDLGSGAGFPGIALAIGCKRAGRGHVTLVESAGKKANFLRTVIRELDLPATVWADRAEKMSAQRFDVISARAFAPLPRLFTYSQRFWGEGTKALLLKGANAAAELTEAEESWSYVVKEFPSQSDPNGVILQISDLEKRNL